MRACDIRIEAEAPDGADARFCLAEYFRELARRFEAGYDPNQALPVEAGELTPPAGVFVVARCEGEPVGCAALRVRPGEVGEIKRMWVAPQARGLGLGRRLLESLEEWALRRGLLAVRLDTNRALGEAQMLYRKCGYVEVERFNDDPYAHLWFAKPLR